MREENVTKNILEWLIENDWTIVCYDFPQSGTGVILHQNNELHTTKNKGSIIPDIIAVKNGIALFFENKDRFYQQDFDKLFEIKTMQNFSGSLGRLLSDFTIKNVVYGIGISDIKKEVDKSKSHLEKIDFLISSNSQKEIFIHYDVNGIFSNT
ncbi:hypothetical protein [Bizionia sp. APA-3]|nr:hypothetical protein [Bizionia sp. APA-3]OBX22677.1 hypothetical protein BAA08_07645 [Bizionia sp. APA-3]